MIPFLKLKRQPIAGLIVRKRSPDGEMGGEGEVKQMDEDAAGIESCAYALMTAIQSSDAKAVAQALKDAIKILYTKFEAEEHEDQAEDAESKAEDASLNTYKYQNVKATAFGEEHK